MFKKILVLFLCAILIGFQNLPVWAQTVKIPAGTPVTIYVNEEIDADDVQLDEIISFKILYTIGDNVFNCDL